jgi:dTDP-4-dehydrorhamnose 3,5-epimerase
MGIEGVTVVPLKQIKDDRGMVMHMLKADFFDFSTLGEIYFSVVYQGAVKGWKKHKQMHQNYAVCAGQIKLVIYDDRPHSSTKGQIQTIITGRDNFARIHLPPGVWYAHAGLSQEPAVITNCATMQSSAEDILRLPLDTPLIPYRWANLHSGKHLEAKAIVP